MWARHVACVVALASARPNKLALVPPMGWMSWEIFRCTTNCTAYPQSCISEALYRAQTDELVAGGYLAAGYSGIHLDDCIMDQSGRDPVSNQLRADPSRFPSGFAALGDYMHGKHVQFGLYTAESTTTCGGWPASRGFEALDAQTFAAWGVDYLKADGCGDPTYYPTGYKLMGAALANSVRNITFSCSWPAYLGADETQKPFSAMLADGCNLWRNFLDMQCNWGYLSGIIDHWGNYSSTLAEWAGPGHWHDPDMLLVGNDCISDDAARTQMAVWAVIAAPLIMGNDLRRVTPSQRSILLNADAIAVNQDVMGKMGVRLTNTSGPTQVWYRPLANGDVAVVLYNKANGQTPPDPHLPWHTLCADDTWNITTGGYFAPKLAQPWSWCFNGRSLYEVTWDCCNTPDCAGFNFSDADGTGCWFKDVAGGYVQPGAATDVVGYTKVGFQAPTGAPADITVNFADIGLFPGTLVQVFDIWQHTVVATTNASSWTAMAVPWQGSSFVRLSAV